MDLITNFIVLIVFVLASKGLSKIIKRPINGYIGFLIYVMAALSMIFYSIYESAKIIEENKLPAMLFVSVYWVIPAVVAIFLGLRFHYKKRRILEVGIGESGVSNK